MLIIILIFNNFYNEILNNLARDLYLFLNYSCNENLKKTKIHLIIR